MAKRADTCHYALIVAAGDGDELRRDVEHVASRLDIIGNRQTDGSAALLLAGRDARGLCDDSRQIIGCRAQSSTFAAERCLLINKERAFHPRDVVRLWNERRLLLCTSVYGDEGQQDNEGNRSFHDCMVGVLFIL